MCFDLVGTVPAWASVFSWLLGSVEPMGPSDLLPASLSLPWEPGPVGLFPKFPFILSSICADSSELPSGLWEEFVGVMTI